MKEHLRKKHPGTLRARAGRPPKDEGLERSRQRQPWRSVFCQRLFPSKLGSAYFEVQAASHLRPSHGNDEATNTDGSELGPNGAESYWNQINEIRMRDEDSTADIIQAAVRGEISPWLERAGFTLTGRIITS